MRNNQNTVSQLTGNCDIIAVVVTADDGQISTDPGGIAVNDQKVASIEVTFDQEQFAGEGLVIKKGKKVFHRAFVN